MVFLPFAAPSTGAFIENSPLGARQGCRASAEGQELLLLTLDKSEERRKQAATGSPFLWLLSFRLHGQIFAPAISAFTTSLWIMQGVEHQQ